MSHFSKTVRSFFTENTLVLALIFVIPVIVPAVVFRPTEVQYQRNCHYFQSRMTALRECATLPGCTVTSEEFAYTATREQKWCRR